MASRLACSAQSDDTSPQVITVKRKTMRAIAVIATIGTAVLVAACAGTPVFGSGENWRGPSLAQLQQLCGEQEVDFGQYASAVHSATFDAFVANRRGRISHEQFCGFQTALADQYEKFGTSSDQQARAQWITFLNDQRATAISWRAFVDPTLRAG
jgi:FlaG/FlaF family flagellin (archaellin)